MKKLAVFLASALLVMSMAACGQKENGGSNAGASNKPNTEQSSSPENNNKGSKDNESALSVEELIEKSATASADLKSYSADMTMEQDIVVGNGEQKQEQKTKSVIKTDFQKEPMVMYQDILIEVPGQGEQKMIQYVSTEGVFTQVEGNWIKQDGDVLNQLLASLEDSMKPEKQLENFKTIADQAKVTVEGDNYVLAVELSGDNVKEMASKLLSQGAGAEAAAMLETMNIKSLTVKSLINKETFFTVESGMTMEAATEMEGTSMAFEMKMTTKQSKFNEVAEIKIPQEALDAQAIQ